MILRKPTPAMWRSLSPPPMVREKKKDVKIKM